VVLDMHHYDELYANPAPHLDRFTNIWVQLARHYANYPDDKLIFELINEPRDQFSGDVMSNAQNRVLSMVRQSNPTRIVILSGDDWATTKGLKNLYIPPDPNIMVSVHYYDPFKFTHQGASWTDKPLPVGATWGSEKDIKDLAAYADALAKWQEKHKVPIYFGEFGVIDNVSVAQRAKWTAAVRSAMEAVNISWCYFDFATGFHAFDQRRGIWSPLILDALVPKAKAGKATS
jgi:endoglucanase